METEGDTKEVEQLAEDAATLAKDLGFGQESSEGAGEGEAPPAEGASEAPEGAAPAEGAAAPAAEATETPSKEPAPDRPKSWKKEALADWDKLPQTVRSEVLRREEDFFKGIEQYKEAAGVGKSFYEAIQPFAQTLRQHNIDPVAHTRTLMAAHHALALGTPEQKLQMLHRLATDYGVQLTQGASREAPYTDPTVAALQSELLGLKSTVTQSEQRYQEQMRTSIRAQVDAFAQAPGHEHFDAVADDITQLIQSGACSTLQDAYDKAIWSNPTTRAQLLEKAQADALAKTNADRAAKAAATKKALAANVKSSAKNRSPTAPAGSMDETLNKVADKLFAAE